MLKKIVAEKGFSGYKNRYYLILQEIITKDTVYEELSDESKAILHQETGLDEEKIKVMSELVYGKPVPDADAETGQKPLQTKIGFVLSLLPYRKSVTYNPLPEDKRLNSLDEYVALLELSLYMLKVYNGPAPSDAPVLFRKEIRKLVHKHYSGEKYDGLIKLFNDNVIVDLSMYCLS